MVNSSWNSGCTFLFNYVITICEMQWSHLTLNLAKILYGCDLNNVWHLLVALVCNLELVCENSKIWGNLESVSKLPL